MTPKPIRLNCLRLLASDENKFLLEVVKNNNYQYI